MVTPIEYLSSHPKLSLLACFALQAGAYHVSDFTMPVIIMQIFQIMAWTVTIIVGCITILTTVNKWLKKYFKKHPEKKKDGII